MYSQKLIEQNFNTAREIYGELGVDVNKALDAVAKVGISLHCWQGDDVNGFENKGTLTGGIQATGNYPGKARNPEELRADLNTVLSLLPGKNHKVNLHAIYLDTDTKVERNEIEPKHFESWVGWAKEKGLGLDFNGTYFSHPLSDDGFTLSHPDEGIRNFWIQHGIACRKIGEYFGKELGKTCVTNIWIPDGYKDIPVDRYAPRKRLLDSLDKMLNEKIDRKHNLDAVESKLFGIGSESYVVGSHEFYMGYALKNNILLCMDVGHFHPTETVSNKISSMFCYMDELLLHVSRPVRWDSDHAVVFDDELQLIAQELIRNEFLNKTHIALDFFDASINRIGAWAIGSRNTIKAILMAMLEPSDHLRELEQNGDYTSRLLLLEELKSYPYGAVWDYYCMTQNVPVKSDFLEAVKKYEADVLSKR